MTTFPASPRLLKGALIAIDLLIPPANVVVFQYTPDTLTRKLDARATTQEGERSEAMRLTGPPKETITLSIEIDAADQLEKANPVLARAGVNPTLAALELMLYPKNASVIANDLLNMIGTIEIFPVDGPMILFVWGPARVLPVRLTSFSITEEAYDPLLNPIRAKVDLTLNVLSYHDLPLLGMTRSLFLTHHIAKEVMAISNIFNNASSIGTSLKLP
jgi:hypothetical protein